FRLQTDLEYAAVRRIPERRFVVVPRVRPQLEEDRRLERRGRVPDHIPLRDARRRGARALSARARTRTRRRDLLVDGLEAAGLGRADSARRLPGRQQEARVDEGVVLETDRQRITGAR